MDRLPPSRKREIEYAESFPESRRMLEKIAKAVSTKVSYGKAVRLLSEFLRKDPTQIVDEYKADAKKSMYDAFDKWERTFDDFTIFLEKYGFGSATVHLYHAGAKALINCNVPRSMMVRAKSPEVYSRSIPPVTFDDLKKVYGMAGVRDRAIIAFFKDSGISAADAVGLNFGDLEGFGRGEKWARIKVYREKEHVEYETFLGPNATEALRAYAGVREQKGERTTEDSPLFVTETKPFRRLNLRALRADLRQVQRSTGIVISTHRLRKFFETYMALTVRHPIVLKYWMGHKVKGGRDVEAKYIIPPTPEQLRLYKESYKNIDLTGGTMEERVKAIEQIMEKMTPEQRELMRKHGVTMMRKREGGEGGKDTETNGGQATQRIAGEEELGELLTQGYRVILTLPSGKIVVER